MRLFGYITLIEMQMALAVDTLFPDDAWRERVTEARLAAAERIQQERARWGQHAQFADWPTIAGIAQDLDATLKRRGNADESLS